MLGFILIFVITIFVAYILGLTLVNVVDKRLSNISIKVPKQNVTLNMEHFDTRSAPAVPERPNPTFEPNTRPTNFTDILQEVKDKETPHNLNGADQHRDYRLRPDLFNSTTPPENSCQLNHLHENCTYGPTNYPDPTDMSLTERRAFANNYPQNMTLQDYINWLWINKHKENNPSLATQHQANLKKLKSSIPLRYQPGTCPPPPRPQKPETAAEHFANIYEGSTEFKYSLTHPLHEQDPNIEAFTAANYEDAETMSDANHLGTPCDTGLPLNKEHKKMNAETLWKLTTPQMRPERYVHFSPAKPHNEDQYRV